MAVRLKWTGLLPGGPDRRKYSDSGKTLRILHIHDRWSDRGGADWYLISLLDRLPASLYKAGLFGRPEGTGFEDHAPSGGVHYIKHLDRRAPFAAEQQVGRAVRDFIAGFRPT
jgi:hypothetical protein